MEESARRFARQVLIAHVAALVLILLLVFFAGREIYASTRAQALEQVQRRQALLANQTARGIESFYDSILSDLDLLQRSETQAGETAATQPAMGATTQPMDRDRPMRDRDPREPGQMQSRMRGFMFARPLWQQLEGRVSHLFVFEKSNERVFDLAPRNKGASPDEIVARMTPWLKSVDKKMISSFQLFGNEGLNLVCIPADPQKNRILVAVVPVKQIEERFLSKINADPTLGATLLDQEYKAMATSKRELIGVNMLEASPPDHQALIKANAASGQPFQLQFHEGTTIKGIKLPPAILAIEPIHLPPNKQWWIYMALPMSEIDGAIQQVFRKAMIWAIGVVVLMTGVLVSTSIQMIRGRVRVERIRHEILTKELEEARRIQLAWLPKAKVAHGQIDIAARNDPASHISGDFYNWFDLPDGRVAITIGDVTGHGMSAAFLMATTQLLVRTTMLQTGDPGKALTEINRQLCQQVFNGQFVTMALLVIDPTEQTLDLALAGHMPPLIGEAGVFRSLPSEPQLVLGVEPDETYPTERYALTPGSLLILYTDGVIDALSPAGQRFKLTGVEQSLATVAPTNASEALTAITSSLDQFRAGRILIDDLTLVAVQAATVSITEPAISRSGV